MLNDRACINIGQTYCARLEFDPFCEIYEYKNPIKTRATFENIGKLIEKTLICREKFNRIGETFKMFCGLSFIRDARNPTYGKEDHSKWLNCFPMY